MVLVLEQQQYSRSASPTIVKRLLSRPLSRQFRIPVQYPCPRLLRHALPWEIFIAIAGFLESEQLLNFSLTSSQFRRFLMPELYRTVALDSTRACLSGLVMLRKRPELCVYIHSLTVRPNCGIICWPRMDGPINEGEVAAMIEGLADELENLEKFVWGGSELPPDALWVTLRRACPMLKQVGSWAGCGHLSPGCELFNFDNLTSFSLSVLPGPKKEFLLMDLPHTLWDMLLLRSASLQELTLQLFYSSHHLHDFDRLLTAVFPHLRALHLDIMCYDNVSPPMATQPFTLLGPFLAAHPRLTDLSIHPFPDTLPLQLPATALPALTAFVGVYHHVAELPRPEVLQTLDLTGAPVGAAELPAVVRALRRLVALTSLDVRLAAPAILSAIVEACGGLTTLRVVFYVNFGLKSLRGISLALQRLPHLRSFTLYKGHRLKDGTMLRCALTLLAGNPALAEVHLAWFALERFARRQNGDYVVRCDETGVGAGAGTGRRYVDVRERGVRPANVGGGVFGRRFRYALDVKGDLRGSVGRGLARIRR